MRSSLWFVIAGVIAIAGFGASGFYVYSCLSTFESQLKRVVVPGSALLDLDQPGNYTIYHEQPGMVDSEVQESVLTPGLRIALTSDATGNGVPLDNARSTMSYSVSGRRGTSILAFTIDRPGKYRLSGRLPGEETGPKVLLTVEHGAVNILLRTIFGAVAMAFAGLGIAGTIVGITIWQRMKARKA